MTDPQRYDEMLEEMGPVTVTLEPDELCAVIGQVEVANHIAGNMVGSLPTIHEALRKLSANMPAELRAITKNAGLHAQKDLLKRIRNALFAAATAAGECPN